MVKQFIKKHAKLKWLLLSLLNWYDQVLRSSPIVWYRIPKELYRFWHERNQYKKILPAGRKLFTYPILFQRGNMPFDAHYTYQAAWASRRIIDAHPKHHVDISSDFRFVSVLSAFVSLTYVEYRPTKIILSGLEIQQGDIHSLPFEDQSLSSISCLHVIEHIGLGRYGDPIDSMGSEKALRELGRVLSLGGILYLSTPIGQPRTLFNAHRIFDPVEIPQLMPELKLIEFSVVKTDRTFLENVIPLDFADEEYACGLYLFKKIQ